MFRRLSRTMTPALTHSTTLQIAAAHGSVQLYRPGSRRPSQPWSRARAHESLHRLELLDLTDGDHDPPSHRSQQLDRKVGEWQLRVP